MTMPVFGAGQRVSGNQLNLMARKIDQNSSDITNLINPPLCIATRVANQVIGTAAVTAISLDTEVYDPLNMFAAPAATFTIPFDGIWVITAGGQWESAATGERLIMIYANGVEQVGGGLSTATVSTAAAVRQSAKIELPLVAGNTVEMRAFQTSGANRNFIGRLSASIRSYDT